MNKFALESFKLVEVPEEYSVEYRRHQGIPGIEVIPSGRMFTCWYVGHEPGEGPGNYVILAVSDDGGRSWREVGVVKPNNPAYERAYDSTFWFAPDNRLWLFWSQCHTEKLGYIFDGRAGVWAACCDNPDDDKPQWSEPRRLADGVMMNKPTVLADGSWVLPVSLWSLYHDRILPGNAEVAKANLLITRDRGKTFELIIGPRIDDPAQRSFDEHMMVEKQDGSWWVLIRGNKGIYQNFSQDKGKTWSKTELWHFGPSTRFAIRRLKSGNLVLVYHRSPRILPGENKKLLRENLTAWISEDDGKTWRNGLLIDHRDLVSYPDMVEGKDGYIYVVYDHARVYHGQILVARFTEKDLKAGELITPGTYLNLLVSAFPN